MEKEQGKGGKPPRLPRPLAVLLCVVGVPVLSVLLALFMKNGSTYHTGSWDSYSEALVYGRMLQMQQGQSAPGGFMGVYSDEWGDTQNRYDYLDGASRPAEQYRSYTHQTGLQGWFFGMVNRLLLNFSTDGTVREGRLFTLNSVLYYAVTLCICLGLAKAAGWAAAAGWLLAALFAPAVQTGMKNLYWCLWLWWLPLLAGLVLCKTASKRHRCPDWCYALVFLACFLRCLCGFEFISDFLILAELPLVWCWAAHPQKRRAWLKRMALAGVYAVGGVAAALGVWLVQGVLYFGSFAQSWQNIAGAAGSRMSISDDTVRAGVSVLGVVQKYLFADTTPLLAFGPVQLTAWQVLAAAGGALALTAAGLWLLKRRAALCAVKAPALCWALSLLAPISWMVLSKAHADIHTQLMPVLWHFAFVPASCALVGVLLRAWVCALRQKAV